MNLLLIGHRGIGKTCLLRRIEKYFHRAARSARFLDLDAEIARINGRSIEHIFAEDGEEHFRLLEETALKKLLEEPGDAVIALGAGYRGWMPEDAKVVWVRRVTDEAGRIFLDRPRLNAKVLPLEEFFSRKTERDRRYAERSDLSLFLREGVEEFDQGEFEFFTGDYGRRSGILTLTPEMKPAVLQLPAEKFEVRDDLVDHTFDLEHSKILFSKRLSDGWVENPDDWPLELGEVRGTPSIVSVHERLENESLEDCFRRLRTAGGERILKASPLVQTFEDLWAGFAWQQEDPGKRAFLPRSSDGRWKWFRLFMKGKMPLNFWRIDGGSAPDQPTFLEWLNHSDSAGEFAAVLGNPVVHSRTPVEQESFFAARNWPVYAIQVAENEWTEAFPILQRLGLRAAAVTSPLKNYAFVAASSKTEEAEALRAVNTLFIDKGCVYGHNTDLHGLREAVKDLELPKPVAVWGGGGTLEAISRIFPQAMAFSARTGLPRDEAEKTIAPRSLIWAGGRDKTYRSPPDNWNLEVILDMNYTENSVGRELALLRGCRYFGGLAMFKAQAEGQRHYWRSLLEGKKK